MHWFEGRWMFDECTQEIVHYKSHERNEGEILDRSFIDVVINRNLVNSLVNFLQDNHYVKPVYSNLAREEDLKITHKLLDIIDKRGLKE